MSPAFEAYLARLYIDSDAWTSVLPWDGRIESAHELRLEKAWLEAQATRNQARFSVLYADDRGSSFTFANDVAPAPGVK